MLRIEILAVVLSFVLVVVFGLLRARQLRFLKWLVAAFVANLAFVCVGIFHLESDGEITLVPTLYVLLLAAITGVNLVICSIARLMNWYRNYRIVSTTNAPRNKL
jgi:hypothetical protein